MKSFKSFLNEADVRVSTVYSPENEARIVGGLTSPPSVRDEPSKSPMRQIKKERTQGYAEGEAIDSHRDEMLKSAHDALNTAVSNKDISTIQNIVGSDVDLKKIEGMKSKGQSYGYPSIKNHMENLMKVAAKEVVDKNSHINDPKQISMLAHEHMMSTNPHYRNATDTIKDMGMENHLPAIADVHFGRLVRNNLKTRDERLKTKEIMNRFKSSSTDEVPY